MLNVINYFRKPYYVQDLQLNPYLSRDAQNIAKFNAENNIVGHEIHPLYPKVGSIQKRRQDSRNDGFIWEFNPQQLIDDIVSSSGDYEWYDQEPPSDNVDQFHDYAQLIWKSSRRLGVGCSIVQIPNGNDSWVKNYNLVLLFDPPGAVPCHWRQNFLPNCECDNWIWLRNASLDGTLKPSPECIVSFV